MSYVVASKLKEFINSKGMMSAGDLAESVSKYVEEYLGRAVQSAQANDRKTVRGSDLLVFSPSSSAYVVASKVKEFVNGKGMMSAGDLAEYVSAFVEWSLGKAIQRASANGRKTVRGEDF
jgi:histone H3/H4